MDAEYNTTSSEDDTINYQKVDAYIMVYVSPVQQQSGTGILYNSLCNSRAKSNSGKIWAKQDEREVIYLKVSGRKGLHHFLL